MGSVEMLISSHTVVLVLMTVLTMAVSEPCYNDTNTCTPVTGNMCLTAKITFTHTSTLFHNGTLSQADLTNQLDVWSALKRVPECWKIIQPFLCSVYLPKCDNTTNEVELPNQELCERVREPCSVVQRDDRVWPWFLQCDQWFYAQSCGQTHFETSTFDTTGECLAPLISTEAESNWFDEIKGCGVQCENPMYTHGEHHAMHVFVGVMGSVCLACTLFTMITFMIDWKVGRKYPAVILFFINGCLLVCTLGWMAQFIDPTDVVCRKDGTIRQGEPLIGEGETASCTVVYILVYYFMMAAVVWFCMLTYSWDITFKALGTVRDDLTRKTSYFHIISWCLPLVMTIVCLSISEIDADSLSGICFPGYNNGWIRTGFVLAPIVLVLIVGTVFSVRGLLTLLKVQKDSPQFMSDKATAKIQGTIVRLGIFTILIFVFVLTSVSVHIYTFTSDAAWQDSFKQYMYCQANISVIQMLDNVTSSSCEMESRPSIVAMVIHVLSFFGAVIAMSSWTWTRASLEAWERLFRKIFNIPVNKPQPLRKHRLVKRRRFKRRKKRMNERLSISYGSEHDDPVGMKFDLSSQSSHSMSSGFAVTMSKHGRHRRQRGMSPARGYGRHLSESDIGSLASKMSSARRQSSHSSRRESYESSMSQKLSDIERDIRDEERLKRRRKRRKKRQNRVQPILEPISSTVAAMQAHRARHARRHQRHLNESSDFASANQQEDRNRNGNVSMGTSNILSESVTTDNSISEIILPPPPTKHQPDFSIFTANTMLPPTDNKVDTKGDNSNGNTTNLKGANPSPSGSFRRGRRREVKLEMTETSFYQEDEDNIEMGGNQTFHREDNCHESGEIRNNLKELGPLVTEIFEQARANSGNGRTSSGRNSAQRDPMGSSRIGSASSRGSRGSRGSQTHPKDFKYATTKVCLPDRPSHDTDNFSGRPNKRPFSGDYVLVSKRNGLKHDSPVRKSQSQPGSRVSSATDHKRQIGYNGRVGYGDALSWSRFLQSKGHAPGQIFTPQYSKVTQGQDLGQGQSQTKGQLAILDKVHYHHNLGQTLGGTVDVLNLQKDPIGEIHYKRGNVKYCVPTGKVDLLDIEREHFKQKHIQRPPTHCGSDYSDMNVDVLNIEEEQNLQKENINRKYKDGFSSNHPRTVNTLNIEEEQRLTDHSKHRDKHLEKYEQQKNVDVLSIEKEQKQNSKHKDNSVGRHKQPKNVDILNIEEEQKHRSKQKHNKTVNVLNIEDEQKHQQQKQQSENVNVLNVEAEHSSKTIDYGKNTDYGKINEKTKTHEKGKDIEIGKTENDLNKTIRNSQTIEQSLINNKAQSSVKATDAKKTVANFDRRDDYKAKENFFFKKAKDTDKTKVGQVKGIDTNKTKATIKENDTARTKAAVKTKNIDETKSTAQNINSSSKASSNDKVNSKNNKTKESDKNNGNNKTQLGSAGSSLRSSEVNTGSVSSHNTKHGRRDSLRSGSGSTTSSRYNRGRGDGNRNYEDLIDYDDDDDYEDFTDELTDTYTYTSYDDDLTEVSSLPC